MELTKSDISHLSYLRVDLAALKKNLALIKQRVSPARVLAVVKDNAYGHGIAECAKALADGGADYFGVAFVEEARAIRAARISLPILAFGGIWEPQVPEALKLKVELTISSIDKLQAVQRAACSENIIAKVHLKIDTGMNRIGVRKESATKLADAALACSNIEIAGVYSHFACADEPDNDFTARQFEDFISCTAQLGSSALIRHISNSGAVIQYPEMSLDMVRVGAALYGVAPSPELRGRLPLTPVMSLHSRVVYFKVVKKGQSVSYGRKWHAERDTRVITVPVGYGDGYPRGLSNNGSVLVGGKVCPVIGAVCMDQLMVDIGQQGSAYNGDEVVLMDGRIDDLSCEVLATHSGLIPHAVLVGFNARLPRVFVEK